MEGALVTLDAMGCQKEIAQRIRDRKGDYLLVLKANHRAAYAAAEAPFERCCFGRDATLDAMRSREVFDATRGVARAPGAPPRLRL